VTAAQDLARTRAETLAQIDALTREFDDVVAASAASNGDCVECGRDISLERLEARPQARTCIDCAR
jgi:RNA polymerase-binding transcription factor DksA